MNKERIEKNLKSLSLVKEEHVPSLNSAKTVLDPTVFKVEVVATPPVAASYQVIPVVEDNTELASNV